MAEPSSPIDFPNSAEDLERIARRLRDGDGGGTSGGMEERVARLEKHVDKLVDDTTTLRVDVATLKENVRHLPTKSFIVTTFSTGVAAATAVVAFGDKIRAIFS